MTKKAPSEGEEQSVDILPTPLEFLIQVPLYKEYKLGKEHETWVNSIQFIDGPLDVYCIYCNDRSLFHSTEFMGQRPQAISTNRSFYVELGCSRVTSHRYSFTVRVNNQVIQKTGQYPSVADISIPQLVKYRGLLGNKRYREFTKAVGLAAHGVGIGSFVYLRRVLESLIEEAHQEAAKSPGWDEKTYARERMADKILLLKNHLPEFMVKHRSVYGILSKGIHALTEQECLKYFKPLQSAIEMILTEHIIRDWHRKNIEQAEKELADVHQELSDNG